MTSKSPYCNVGLRSTIILLLIILILILFFSQLIIWSIKHQKNVRHSVRAQGDVIKCIVLSVQQSKPQRYLIYLKAEQRVTVKM